MAYGSVPNPKVMIGRAPLRILICSISYGFTAIHVAPSLDLFGFRPHYELTGLSAGGGFVLRPRPVLPGYGRVSVVTLRLP